MKQLLTFFFLLSSSTVFAADVIPGEQCKPWEHWEGDHGGRCACSCVVVGAPSSDDVPIAMTLGVLGLVALRRRR